MNTQACIEEILLRGLDDWIQAAELAWVAKSIGQAFSVSDHRALSLSLVRQLLASGLCEPGDVTEPSGFIRWGTPIAATMQRIESCWPNGAPSPELGSCFWLRLTAEGERQAISLLASKRSSET
jgi:hypothetical protein